MDQIDAAPDLSTEPFERCLAALEPVEAQIGQDTMTRPDAQLVRREFALTARLMRHACRRGLFALGDRSLRGELRSDMQEIISEYEKIWLARNRPGGLPDSTLLMRKMVEEYGEEQG